jgi:hypothetical protein
MLTIFLSVAATFFFFQGIIGCFFLYGLLQLKREHGKLSGWVMAILTWLVYGLTMGGIYALVTIYAEYKADVTEVMMTVFVITGCMMLFLLFIVLKGWNQLLQKLK